MPPTTVERLGNPELARAGALGDTLLMLLHSSDEERAIRWLRQLRAAWRTEILHEVTP
jgi:hypothetical protein